MCRPLSSCGSPANSAQQDRDAVSPLCREWRSVAYDPLDRGFDRLRVANPVVGSASLDVMKCRHVLRHEVEFLERESARLGKGSGQWACGSYLGYEYLPGLRTISAFYR